MRVLLQRVREASVSVGGDVKGAIGQGLTLFVGIAASDGDAELEAMSDKVAGMRIFEDDDGRMNLSAHDLLGRGDPVGALVISQFTLYGDVRKGRRPSFIRAAAPDLASPAIERFAGLLRGLGLTIAEGRFGAHMLVSLVNDGPVTIWIDSDDLTRSRRTGTVDPT